MQRGDQTTFRQVVAEGGTTALRKRSRNGEAAGDEETFTRRLYVHVFHSPDNDAKKELAFREDLLELKAQLENGVTEFTKTAQRKIDRYLVSSKTGRGGQFRIGYNDEAIAKAKHYFGYFALVSNQAMDTFTALENYRRREKIEALFADQKGDFDGARPRTWYPDNLRGRQFVQFVALGYLCFLTKKIKDVQARLAKNEDGKTRALLTLEKKLDKWLEQRSLAQLLDWFDCIETTTVPTAWASISNHPGGENTRGNLQETHGPPPPNHPTLISADLCGSGFPRITALHVVYWQWLARS